MKQTDASTGANWTNPLLDDDEDSPYCTPNSNVSTDPFACKSIRCITQRKLVTDDTKDFIFEVGKKILIRPGRALLGLNTSGCGTACQTVEANVKTNEVIELTILAGANTLLAGAATALAALTMLSF